LTELANPIPLFAADIGFVPLVGHATIYLKKGNIIAGIVTTYILDYNGGTMILYNGKAKDYSFKQLLYNVYWLLSRPIEKLEPEDFSKN